MSIKWETLKTKEDLEQEKHGRECEVVRVKRDKLLAETDFYLLPDYPNASQEVLDYRQALRDVTGQKGFPFGVVWPELNI